MTKMLVRMVTAMMLYVCWEAEFLEQTHLH